MLVIVSYCLDTISQILVKWLRIDYDDALLISFFIFFVFIFSCVYVACRKNEELDTGKFSSTLVYESVDEGQNETSLLV
jgi:hypothetical protein